MTGTQLNLFDHAEAQRRKEEGMALAEAHAGPVWAGYALSKLHELCRMQELLHSDDLRAVCELTPASANAYGSVWLTAIRKGWIERTGRSRPSTRPETHGHTYVVYRSLVFGQTRAA